jgi:putative ABC transport system permease protein
MNLATARSAERAREVGVRKVMGSFKAQLVFQFLTEAIFLSIGSTLVAIAFVFLLLPYFNNLVEKQLQFLFTIDVIGGLISFALLVGILAGMYPAFVLSGFNPVVVMKGKFSGSRRSSWLRNGLVVFQFVISIVLIVGTIVIGNQMRYMQNKDLGFDKEQVLMIKRAFALDQKTETFIEELKRISEVKAAAATSSIVGNRFDFFGQFFKPEGATEILTVKSMIGDDEFTEMIGFHLKEGRMFSKETNDSLNVLVNETCVRTMGLSNPIGAKISQVVNNNDGTTTNRPFTILGIVKDFNFQSLRDEITPLVIFNRESFGPRARSQYVAARLKPNQVKEAIQKIETKWKAFIPEQPFKYEFLDDNLNQGYADEQRSGKMFALFSGLAIVIACVGLFGLSAYMASLRTKEIGIRKVLGSSVREVVILLSKDFTKLVVIAFLVAVPLSWWMMDSWLKGFAYRVNLGAASFVIAGVLALGIALLTVSYQSIKAAMLNPAKSLKQE